MDPQNPVSPDPSQGFGQSDQQQSFTYGFMAFQCKATLDAEHLSVKQGLRTFEASVPKLRHLYLQQSAASSQVTLLLAEERSAGKNRVLRLYANPGDLGFLGFVDAILALRPDIDLRGLPEKTALKKMGAANHDLIGLVIMVFILPTIIGVGLLPKLVHGIEFGQERISLTSIAKGKTPRSHNVLITGARAKLSESIEVTTTTKKGGVETGATTKYFVPLVPNGWEKDQPVHVILETDEMNSADEAKLERATKFSGVVRDVLWEGLSSDDREYFVKDAGLKLSDHVKLVEYRANPQFDLLVFLGATGLTFVIMLAIATGMWLKKRRG